MANQRATLFIGRARWTLAIVFLLSAIGLAYEVTLTRLFSLMFQYHYVFLIVSVAVAGLSGGAALAALMTRRGRPGDAWTDLAYAALLLALILVSTTVVLSQMRSAGRIVVAVAASLLPFVGIGFLNATLFASFAEVGGVLYAADLVGGAVGLGAALGVIGWLGAFDALLALSVASAAVAVIFALITGLRSLQLKTSGVAALLLAVLVANRATGVIDFSPRRLADAPPDKTLMAVLKDPSARITATRWGPFARLDLVETSDSAVRYVFTDAGAGSVMVHYTGDGQEVAWLRQEVAYLPFTIAPDSTKNVLILGSGAGKDVLMAHLAGAESITAVEINPELVSLTRAYADYNGHIYDLPGVQTEVTDGRNFVDRSDSRYDLIYANLVYSQAAAPGNSALAESYIFTREALQAYWGHLTDNGRIGFVTHQGIEGLRLLVAGLDMLENNGMTLQDALKHVALASLRGDDPQTRTSVVIIQRQPWTSETANAFTDEVHNRQAGLLYMPTVMETGLQGLVAGTMDLRTYIKGNADEYNFTPTTDDSPFFFQFTPGLPGQISDLLVISAILTAIYLSWAMFFFLRRTQHWKRVGLAPYFAVLGVAFMLIEIPLIQHFDLLLGEPVLALVAVVGALLVGGGVGSLLSNRVPVDRLPRLAVLFTLGIAAVALASRMIYPALIDRALPATLPVRLVITVVALLPLGFLMGMPFPSGLRIAHRADPEGVAAFWGANAIASVLGSALAMTLAISVGFSAALLLGAALYGLAAVMIFLIWPRLLA
jgi:hypothetical protein